MLTEIVNATNAIEGFATYLSSFWTDQPFQTQVGGWNSVPLSREDLISRARRLAERLKSVPDEEVDDELKRKLNNLPGQIAWFQSNTLPQITGGARLDPQLESRLFASALDRLDEAPLRFLSMEEHGSPYEALLASAGFQKALETFPSLRNGFMDLVDKAAMTAAKGIAAELPTEAPSAAKTA
jgi:hypothetical protein